MDEGLFKKHIHQILSRVNARQKIIQTIKEKTGVEIEESEIVILKNKITISTSSVKKAALIQKGSREILEGLGYTLQS